MIKRLLKFALLASFFFIEEKTHASDFLECPLEQGCRFSKFLENWTLGVEFLIFKPTIDQSAYAISSNYNVVEGEGNSVEFFPNGKRLNNSGHLKTGYRLEGQYNICGCPYYAFDFRFTYFNASYKDSVEGFFLFDTNGFPGEGAQAPEDINYRGEARVKDKYRYFAVEATFSRFCVPSCAEHLYFLVGLHYANIEHYRRSNSSGFYQNANGDGTVRNAMVNNSKFWGIGPELGVDYSYILCTRDCNFEAISLNSSLRASLLCSENSAAIHYNTLRTEGSLGVNLINEDIWRVTPSLDCKLSASYTFLSICCLKSCVELGYEWIWYHNAVNTITGLDVAFPGDTLDVFSSFSLQGPFISLNIEF